MSREAFLGRIRQALATGEARDGARREAVSARLAYPPRHPRPAFAAPAGADREARLVRCLEAQGATVISISDLAALPATMAMYLDRTSSSPLVGEDRGGGEPQTPAIGVPPTPQGGVGPPRVFIADDVRLTALVWPTSLTPTRWTPGDTLGDGYAALTHAEAAVAETGTLVLASRSASPASLAFLPEVHIVAVARDTVVSGFEEAFAALAAASKGRLPRAVNLVSGPSRTGDIGGRIVRGAHGPRRLFVILYG